MTDILIYRFADRNLPIKIHMPANFQGHLENLTKHFLHKLMRCVKRRLTNCKVGILVGLITKLHVLEINEEPDYKLYILWFNEWFKACVPLDKHYTNFQGGKTSCEMMTS